MGKIQPSKLLLNKSSDVSSRCIGKSRLEMYHSRCPSWNQLEYTFIAVANPTRIGLQGYFIGVRLKA